MTEQRILAELRAAGAWLEGHYRFSSGRRLPRAARPCAALPQRLRDRFGPVGLVAGHGRARGRKAPVPSRDERA